MSLLEAAMARRREEELQAQDLLIRNDDSPRHRSPTHKCRNCSKPFVSVHRRSEQVFCNRACYFEHVLRLHPNTLGKRVNKRTWHYLTCMQYGKTVLRIKRYGARRNQFCSRSCSNKGRKTTLPRGPHGLFRKRA